MLKTIVLSTLFLSGVATAFPWYASGGFRGAELMNQQEQKDHVARLQSMKTFNECHDYMNAHEVELQKRAASAKSTLAPVKGDPCQVMLQMGRIKNQ
jgi:hypothetical protein